MARLNLPYPEAVFQIDYFRRNPVPCKLLIALQSHSAVTDNDYPLPSLYTCKGALPWSLSANHHSFIHQGVACARSFAHVLHTEH